MFPTILVTLCEFSDFSLLCNVSEQHGECLIAGLLSAGQPNKVMKSARIAVSLVTDNLLADRSDSFFTFSLVLDRWLSPNSSICL